MKLPRNVSGSQLSKSLSKLGYSVTRQRGSHIRLTCQIPTGNHSITVSNHDPIKIGTLSAILSEIATVHQIEKNKLIENLF